MIVFLEELKVEAIADFPSKDALELLESLALNCVAVLNLKAFQNLLGKVLVLIIQHIECDLISNEVVALLFITG